jgi:hypothetical protein
MYESTKMLVMPDHCDFTIAVLGEDVHLSSSSRSKVFVSKSTGALPTEGKKDFTLALLQVRSNSVSMACIKQDATCHAQPLIQYESVM